VGRAFLPAFTLRHIEVTPTGSQPGHLSATKFSILACIGGADPAAPLVWVVPYCYTSEEVSGLSGSFHNVAFNTMSLTDLVTRAILPAKPASPETRPSSNFHGLNIFDGRHRQAS
jgi:hypothetical protein